MLFLYLFITENLSSIYAQSGRTQPKLITYQQETNRTKYRMVMVDKTLARVGSYAEVLKRRFTPVTEKTGEGTNGQEQSTSNDSCDPLINKVRDYRLSGKNNKTIIHGEKAKQHGAKVTTSTNTRHARTQPTSPPPIQKPTDTLTDTIKTLQLTQNQLKDNNLKLEQAVDRKLREMQE